MMKLVLGASALMGFVSAAELPQFSATDDYDELNLNIRLLSTNATNATNGTGGDDSEWGFRVMQNFTMPVTGPDGVDQASDIWTPQSKQGSNAFLDAFMGTFDTELRKTIGSNTAYGTNLLGVYDAARRQLSAQKRRLGTFNVVVAMELQFMSADVANTFVAASSTFVSALKTGLDAALANVAGYSVGEITATEPEVTTASGAPVPAPAPAASPAAPAAKKDASSANKVFASIATVAVAIAASVF